MIRFAQKLKVLPILAPVAVAEAAVATQYIDISKAHWATFMVSLGAAATTASTDIVTVTVECSTAGSSNATETAVPFQYRLAAKVATDSMGAVTAGTSDGVALTMDNATGQESAVAIIEVDPASLPAKLTDGKYLRLVLTPSGSSSMSVYMGVIAVLEPRYAGATIPSAT